MARAPDQTPQESLNVPGVQSPYVPQFGKAGEAMENFGDSVEQNSLNIMDQVNHLTALDSSATAYANTKQFADTVKQQLQLSSPDGFMHDDPKNPTNQNVTKDAQGNPVSIVQEFHNQMDAHYQATQDGLPNGIAQQMYRERALPYLSNQTGTMQTEALQMRVSADNINRQQQLQQAGDALVTNPDVSTLYKNFDDIHKDVSSRIGIVYNASEAQQKIMESYNKLGRDTMQGAYTKVLDQKKTGDTTRVQDIQYWQSVLAGTDDISQFRAAHGQPTLSNSMDPMQKAIEEEKLVRLLPTAKNLDGKDVMTYYEATKTALEMGKGDPASTNLAKGKIIGWALQNPDKSAEASGLLGNLAAANAIGQLHGPSFELLPADEREAMIEKAKQTAYDTVKEWASNFGVGAGSGDLATAATKAIQDNFKTYDQDIKARQNKDYTLFAQKNLGAGQKVANLNYDSLPSLAQGDNPKNIQAAASAQEALYKTNPSADGQSRGPVTLPQSQRIAKQLKDPQSGTEKQGAQGVQALAKAYGTYTTSVVNQMIEDGNLGPEWRIAFTHTDEGQTDQETAIISALRGGKGVDEAFESRYNSAGDPHGGKVSATLADAIHDQFKDYILADRLGHPNSVAAAQLQTSVETAATRYAKQLMLDYAAPDEKTAARYAKAQMLGDGVTIMSTGGTNVLERGWHNVSGGATTSDVEGKTLIPNQWGDRFLTPQDKQTVSDNVSKIFNADLLRKLNTTVPQGTPNAYNYIDTVAKHMWLGAPDEGKGGYPIYYISPDDGKRHQVTHANKEGGQDVTYLPMADLLVNEKDKNTVPLLDRMKQWSGYNQGAFSMPKLTLPDAFTKSPIVNSLIGMPSPSDDDSPNGGR